MKLEHLIPLAPNGQKRTHISLEVRYCKGGLNYTTYREDPRGIYLSATPIGIEVRTDCEIRQYSAFSGIGAFLEEAKRLNQKRVQTVFDEVVAKYKNNTGIGFDLVTQVLAKHGLQLANAVVSQAS